MALNDWQEPKRKDVFETTLRGLERRRLANAEFTIADAQSALEHLYVLEGNDWLGRGELGDIVTSATIAAYEHFISVWKAEVTYGHGHGEVGDGH